MVPATKLSGGLENGASGKWESRGLLDVYLHTCIQEYSNDLSKNIPYDWL